MESLRVGAIVHTEGQSSNSNSAAPVADAHDAQLLAKLKRLYSLEAFTQIRWQFADLSRLGANEEAKALHESLCD
ncbi:MAG TPA: hypothetical protein DDY43_07740 [Synechococcales bacterium UBA10510]|nr:hypothetical protein [Synechococcales bacterium UBA10510]